MTSQHFMTALRGLFPAVGSLIQNQRHYPSQSLIDIAGVTRIWVSHKVELVRVDEVRRKPSEKGKGPEKLFLRITKLKNFFIDPKMPRADEWMNSQRRLSISACEWETRKARRKWKPKEEFKWIEFIAASFFSLIRFVLWMAKNEVRMSEKKTRLMSWNVRGWRGSSHSICQIGNITYVWGRRNSIFFRLKFKAFRVVLNAHALIFQALFNEISYNFSLRLDVLVRSE